MATQYPSKIDNSTTLPEVVDLASIYSAEVYNRLRNAIIAIETELGASPSAAYTSVKNRFETLEGVVGNLEIISLDEDLGGTLLLPKVVGIQGTPVSSTAPTLNQALVFNGTAWAPASLASAGGSLSFTAAGDLSGSSLTQTVIGLQGNEVSSDSPVDGYILTWQDSSSSWKPLAAPSGFSAGGDLSGSASSQTVVALRNNAVLATAPNVGEALIWTASGWEPKAIVSSTYEISLASGLFSTTSSAFTRVGGRKIDLSSFPATVGDLTRVVTFKADIDMTATATSVEIQLYDVTNAVSVTGSDLTSTSTSNVEVSATLTVGSSPGNIRNDTPSQYELQLKMNGGGGSDAVFLTNARLLVAYA